MPELNVSKKSLVKLFSEMQGRKFIIPDYQRPYSWDIERCETLWNDITHFHSNKSVEAEYFLGTIVTFKNGQDLEIIDGQQRLTSLILMLRAFYARLEGMQTNDNVIGLKSQIGPCIWDVDPISTKVNNKKNTHIESKVATERDIIALNEILENGSVNDNAKDLYSINYKFFHDKCQEYATKDPLSWENLCVTILRRCIILPVECDQEETAMEIFSTLNDRGLPLSDSDIFKAKIYTGKKDEKEKENFAGLWKALFELCESAGITIDDVFRYQSHVMRANKGDKTKEISLRKFYLTHDDYKFAIQINSSELMNDLFVLAQLWLYINKSKKSIVYIGKEEVEIIDFSIKTKQYFHVLSWYPNEFWKYAVGVYYYTNRNNKNFASEFESFMGDLTAFMIVKFIEKPTVNAVKDDVFQLCIDIVNGLKQIRMNFDNRVVSENISIYSESKLARVLVLLHAYLNKKQTDMIPKTFDIEHIFPKRWTTANYFGWDEAAAQEALEKLGNKVAIERKLNIQAGNGYFGLKKGRYSKSSIADVVDLSEYEKDSWTKDDIESREKHLANRLSSFFERLLLNVS